MNRMWNARNPYQGSDPKILCVCAAGLLRSPTLQNVLIKQGYNCRAAGSSSQFALIPVDVVLINWADLIVCVDLECKKELMSKFGDKIEEYGVKVATAMIPDNFDYNDPHLVRKCEEFAEQIEEILNDN